MKKLPITTPVIKTKYSDLVGQIEIDWEGRISSLAALCEQHKIDMEKNYLIGFGFESFEADYVICKVLLLEDCAQYGRSFQEIEENISKLRSVNAIQKNIKVSYADLEKYIKHINALVFTDVGLSIGEINIIDTTDKSAYSSDDLPQYS